MAPAFLFKFQKHARDTLSTSPSPKGPTKVPAIITSAPTPIINTDFPPHDKDGSRSLKSIGSDTRSVTIGVVPPSPKDTKYSGSDISLPRDAVDQERGNIGHRSDRGLAPSINIANSPHTSPEAGAPELRGKHLSTPQPNRPRSISTQSPPSFEHNNTAVTVRKLVPASSTGDLRQFVRQTHSDFDDMLLGGSLNEKKEGGGNLERSGSTKSTRSQTISISPSNAYHVRAVTSPNFNGGNGIEEPPPIPISESLTGMLLTASPPSSPPSDSSLHINRTQTLNPNLLVPGGGGKDSDSASIISKKSKGWKKPSLNSQSKKPTGLAAAIAASGMTMANPVVSQQMSTHMQQQQQQMSPPSPSPKLPNKDINGSPTRHKIHNGRHSQVASASVASVATNTSNFRRSRQPSLSLSAGGENSDGMYDSGLEEFGNSDEEGDSDDNDLLNDLREDIPVTGFAVASNKRNADFHELFRSIPEGDYLIEDYGCALQREILIQGRIYISENHICFHANIFGWITDLSIPIYEIISLERKMTAFVIPNAIQITTRQSKYFFASFLSRDTTFDVIYNIWRLSRPDDAVSAISRQTSARNSLENTQRTGMEQLRETGSAAKAVANGGAAAAAVISGGVKSRKGAAILLTNKVTQCACWKKGEHFSETALETIVPGTPEKIYNLMFASGFIKDFMKGEQKLTDIQISDWAPTSTGSKLLARNMSYIKPLNASLGPKQTKCEIRDETTHCNFDDYVVTITTTRTPEVPSGGVFSVKTRTCMMWASAASTKVVVTTQVEWTGRSFIKGIINQSAIDGQKAYHADLDRAMRQYIQQHQSEFVPEGVEAIAVAPIEPQTPGIEKGHHMSLGEGLSAETMRKTREHERNQRSLQWAYDTFNGAYGVAKRSTIGALELVKDAWDQSTSTTILIFMIVILVLSNLYTLTMVTSRGNKVHRKEQMKLEEREAWVQGIVTGLWEELAAGNARPVPPFPPSDNWQQELANLNKTLDSVEERLRLVRKDLNALN